MTKTDCQLLNFALLQRQHADLAGKITGMLLEIDNSELLHMLEDPASLQGKVCSLSIRILKCSYEGLEYLHQCISGG